MPSSLVRCLVRNQSNRYEVAGQSCNRVCSPEASLGAFAERAAPWYCSAERIVSADIFLLENLMIYISASAEPIYSMPRNMCMPLVLAGIYSSARIRQ
jgi:hypothetical protein